MKKRLITVLTLFVCYCAYADSIVTVEYLDVSQAKEQLSKLSKIVFDKSGNVVFDYLSGTTKDFGTVSNTGKITFVEGDLTSYENVQAVPSVKVFPNPTTETVSVVGLEQGQMVSVYSASGLLVLRTAETEFNVSNLAKGQYFLVAGKSVVKLIKK